MDEKPELIAFSQNKIGGVQNFYFNILSNDPDSIFDKKWIFTDKLEENDSRLPQLYGILEERLIVIPHGETIYETAKKLKALISNRPGVVLSNFNEELVTLHVYRKSKKTIFFICHDELYLQRAQTFEFLIDVFIAHNITFYDQLIKLFPKRKNDIYYIPYGVRIPAFSRTENRAEKLRIVMLARITEKKGVFDLPLIQKELLRKNVQVKWTIIGDGPDKQELIKRMQDFDEVSFFSPHDNETVLKLLSEQDIYVLPSRLDGLPVSMLEAMSVGCVPVITEFNEGIKQVLPAEVGYIFPVGDYKSFAETITTLHMDRAQLENRSRLARQLVETQFNIQLRAAEYFNLFSKFKELKKNRRFRIFRHGGGFLDYPLVPKVLRVALRKLKAIVAGN